MKQILLTGANGQVGHELQRALAAHGNLHAMTRAELDLADANSIRKVLRDIKPDIVVNAAAYTAVDKAEDEQQQAVQINGIAPGILAEELKTSGGLLVHYSTDYVFDGTATTPYEEDHSPRPISVYGSSKLAGEQAIRAVDGQYFILRSSWVYGLHGHNFLRTMLRLFKERDEISVVDDQTGVPTWSRFLADVTAWLLQNHTDDAADVTGTYHVCPDGDTSWYGFAREIYARVKDLPGYKSVKIHPIASRDYPQTANRPSYSVLSNVRIKQLMDAAFPSWQQGLATCLVELDEVK